MKGTNLTILQGKDSRFRAYVIDGPFSCFLDPATGAKLGTHCAVVTDEENVQLPETTFLGRGRLPYPERRGVGYGNDATEAARAAFADFRKRHPEEPS